MILTVSHEPRRGEAVPALVVYEQPGSAVATPAFRRDGVEIADSVLGFESVERILERAAAKVLVLVVSSSDVSVATTLLALLDRVRTRLPDLGIVAIIEAPSMPFLRALLESGVNACCAASPETSLEGPVDAAIRGATWLDAESTRVLFGGTERLRAPHLSPREREILGLLTDGYTNEEIAVRIACAPATVKTHLVHLFRKLGVRDRVSAAVWALRNGHL